MSSQDKTPKKKLIEPRTLKGFRDFLPETMIPREQLIARVVDVYRSYGYSPIDTPVLEYLEILTGKGSDETDKQLYRFQDSGGRDVGMRFDLTVPFARFAAQHNAELGLPFKRYHLAKVWRGENTQAGRYREFMQCDFDVIGTTGIVSDLETAMVINDIMERVDLRSDASFTKFQIHVNSRKILNGALEKLNLSEYSTPVLRALDKLAKIGADAVVEEMQKTANASEEQARAILQIASVQGNNDQILANLETQLKDSQLGLEGVSELRQILDATKTAGIPAERFAIDVSIARGLDYYTGTIFETFLTEFPQLGSVCSGGRYDNLAELFTKQKMPGVGASLGLDRLFAGLEELGMLEKTATPVSVFIPLFDEALTTQYVVLARQLRERGVGVELYPEPKKLGAQLKYADKKGFRFAIVLGSEEAEQGKVNLKDLQKGDQTDVALDYDTLADTILNALNS
ncbi:MAG: histidine--tRNA ligase [Planctomycetia bacterium]|nr:histidine--tRNA ligase [Planctomycetia bacterium]